MFLINTLFLLAAIIGPKFANVNAYNVAFITCMVISAIVVVLSTAINVSEKTKKFDISAKKDKFTLNDIFD